MSVKGLLDSVLGSAPVRGVALGVTRARLRILGYHGVERPDVLDRQLAWVRRHLVPVTLDDVIAALDGARPLPDRATWVTFDDGIPSVVELGLPVLTRHGIRATMFVCPGVIGTDRPHWWEIVAPSDLARLKTVPDEKRRALIARLERSAGGARQLTMDQLRAFAELGDIGNHTWDHPMLDRCSDAEQRRQVLDSHEWLSDALGAPPLAFAYPNGNVASAAQDTLAELGYRVAVLHDHRLATLVAPLALSRLRAGDRITDQRFRAIASGAHPALHAIRNRGS